MHNFPGVWLNKVQFKHSMFCGTDLYLHRNIKISCTVANLSFPCELVCVTHIFCLVLNQKQIPKDVANIFNAPSDSEDFPGFQDDASKQSFLSENNYVSFDSLESGKEVGTDCHRPVMLLGCSSTLSLCQNCVNYSSHHNP